MDPRETPRYQLGSHSAGQCISYLLLLFDADMNYLGGLPQYPCAKSFIYTANRERYVYRMGKYLL
jgi:hypothetical protein